MPKKPPLPCREYGCPNDAKKDGYCSEHWQPRSKKYPKKTDPIYSGHWQKVRAAYLRQYPICNRCEHSATIVHHIEEIENGGDPYNWDNLESLCRDCHEKEHVRKKQSK